MRKLWMALLLVTSIAALGVMASFISSTQLVQDANIYSTGIGYNSMVCVYKNGEEVSCKPNLFTNYGKNITRDLLIRTIPSQGNITVISVGNYTGSIGQSMGDSNLTGDYSFSPNSCGLTNATGTVTADALVGVGGNWSISKTFTSTCDSVIVNATGLYNGTKAGTLFAQANFTSVTLQNADQINVTWYIWVQ